MIYLDNSATTFPKPPGVIRAVNSAVRQYGFNPGRGGYPQSVRTAKAVYDTRSAVKDFFGVSGEENVIFTSGYRNKGRSQKGRSCGHFFDGA